MNALAWIVLPGSQANAMDKRSPQLCLENYRTRLQYLALSQCALV